MLPTASLVFALALAVPVAPLLGQAAGAAQEHAERALQFAQQGDLKSAEAELRKAVELSPGDPALLTSLGGILGIEGDLQQASIYLAKAVKLNPQDAVSRRNLAANQWQLGRLKEAHENLDRLIRTNPQDKIATFLLGMVSEKEKNYGPSAALLESVPEVLERQPDGWVALASSYYHMNRREDARRALRQLPSPSANPRVAFLGAQTAMDAHDYQTAEALFASVRPVYSDPAAVEFQIALAQFQEERVAESQKTLLEAVQAKRANREAYALLCRILVQRGSSPRALAIATEAARVFPDAYELVSTKASLEMKLRYFNDAVVSYERAMKLHPSVEGQRGLATAQWRAGMRQQGVSGFKQLLAQFPRDAVTFQVYGTLLLEDGSPEDRPRAIELLKQAIALDASSVEPRYQLANAELGDGKPEQALQYLESAIKLDSQDSRLHFAISRVYRRLGRSSDADREMELYQKLKAAEQPAARNDSALGTQR